MGRDKGMITYYPIREGITYPFRRVNSQTFRRSTVQRQKRRTVRKQTNNSDTDKDSALASLCTGVFHCSVFRYKAFCHCSGI